MKSRIALTVVLFFLFACHNPVKVSQSTTTITQQNKADSANNEWLFDKVSGTVLKFKGGKEFNTNVFALKYIGQMPNDSKAPFLIFSGRDCNECDANLSIYIHSPSDGVLKVENGANRYQYPGTEKDFESDSLLYKGRAFYGEVLPGSSGIIWYQAQLMENNTWKKSIFLVDINSGKKKESALDNYDSNLKLTLGLLKQGSCKEIIGRDFKSEP